MLQHCVQKTSPPHNGTPSLRGFRAFGRSSSDAALCLEEPASHVADLPAFLPSEGTRWLNGCLIEQQVPLEGHTDCQD